MILENIRPFGRSKPGDQVVVPDGVGFDHFYFVEVVPPDDTPPVTDAKPEVKPELVTDEPPETEVSTNEPKAETE